MSYMISMGQHYSPIGSSGASYAQLDSRPRYSWGMQQSQQRSTTKGTSKTNRKK
jgi:hypothetical protein